MSLVAWFFAHNWKVVPTASENFLLNVVIIIVIICIIKQTRGDGETHDYFKWRKIN